MDSNAKAPFLHVHLVDEEAVCRARAALSECMMPGVAAAYHMAHVSRGC